MEQKQWVQDRPVSAAGLVLLGSNLSNHNY